MHGNIHQVLLGTRKGRKNEKTKRNSCPDSDLTYPYPNLLRPLNSATRSEVHKPRLNYRQTKNPHESHRQRVDGATLVTENTQAGTFNTTRSNSTTRAFRPFFFVFIFFSFFFWLRRREKKKKHSKNAYELNDGSLSDSDSYSAVRSVLSFSLSPAPRWATSWPRTGASGCAAGGACCTASARPSTAGTRRCRCGPSACRRCRRRRRRPRRPSPWASRAPRPPS